MVQQPPVVNRTWRTIWTVPYSEQKPSPPQSSNQDMPPALSSNDFNPPVQAQPALPFTTLIFPSFAANVLNAGTHTVNATMSKTTPLAATEKMQSLSTSLGRHPGLRSSLLWSLA